MFKAFALALTLWSATALAQDEGRWAAVSVTKDGMLTEYDTQTIRRQSNTVTVWVRYTYLKSPPVLLGKALHHSIQRQYFNCETSNSAVYAITAYTEDGNVIASESYESPTFSPVIPSSIGEQTLNAVCP